MSQGGSFNKIVREGPSEVSFGQRLDWCEEVSHSKSRTPVVLSRHNRECKAENKLGTVEEQQ